MKKIVVVGGYGAVGRRICTILSAGHPGRVFAAGRSFDKADRLSRDLDGAVEPLALDMNEPAAALGAPSCLALVKPMVPRGRGRLRT